MMDTAFVLGNGPSLRGVDLEMFSTEATIGMNAAYRQWERVGWYPTHYCCLDEELIGTHHDAIRSLVSECGVRSAFVSARILDFHPELAADERYVLLDCFHKPWYERRGRKLGLPFFDHPAFRSSAPSKLTTGAYAVRYGIFLGYRKLYLLGIDCNYVEIVEGARSVGGTALQMTRTPERNPNYFFDDYQQAGDRYNIPNPEAHANDLHLPSMKLVRDDVVEQGLPVEIRNCSKVSRLASDGVFPYEDLDQALGRRSSWITQGIALARTTSNEEDPVMPTRRSLYERFYFWANARSPLIFSAGRLAMWCVRKVRRYPGWAAGYLVLLASLTALGFWPGVEPYGALLWAVAGLLVICGTVVVATGYAGFHIKYAERESQRRDDRIRFEQDRTKEALEAEIGEVRDTLEAEIGEVRDTLEAEIGEVQSEQKRTKQALEAEIGGLKSELATVDELSSAIDALRREVAQPDLRYPAPGSGSWVSFGALEDGSSNHQARLKVSFAGGEGVQVLTQPALLSVEAAGQSQSVGISSLEELRRQGIHAARWELDAPVEVEAIGVLIALKPQGRRFVELRLDDSGPLVSARFDLEEVALLSGGGPDEAAATIQEADGGWRLCGVRLPLVGQVVAAEFRLALARSDDFALDYEGEAKCGVLVADPVATKE